MEYNKCICDMAVGDQVEGFYVLKTAQIRTSNNGRPFLAAVLADKTGSIEGKAWGYSGPISTADEGQVIKIRGSVTEFRGALQLNMDRLRRTEPSDPVDRGALVATAPIDGERPGQRWSCWWTASPTPITGRYAGGCCREGGGPAYHPCRQECSPQLPGRSSDAHLDHAAYGGLPGGPLPGDCGQKPPPGGDTAPRSFQGGGVFLLSLGLVTEYSLKGQLLGHLVMGAQEAAGRQRSWAFPRRNLCCCST